MLILPLCSDQNGWLGGVYEVHASLLRGVGVCGGAVGVPAAAGSRPCVASAVFGSSLGLR